MSDWKVVRIHLHCDSDPPGFMEYAIGCIHERYPGIPVYSSKELHVCPRVDVYVTAGDGPEMFVDGDSSRKLWEPLALGEWEDAFKALSEHDPGDEHRSPM